MNNATIQGTSNNYWNIIVWPGETKRLDISSITKGKGLVAKPTQSLYAIHELHPLSS